VQKTRRGRWPHRPIFYIKKIVVFLST
jgi:hypothetical protein